MNEIEKAIEDLEVLKDGYEHRAKNETYNFGKVGKGKEYHPDGCSTYGEMYSHYTESIRKGISALEKQIPKKPLDIKMLFVPHSTLIKSVYGKCPICDTVQADDEYCQHCGQALDWRNEDE